MLKVCVCFWKASTPYRQTWHGVATKYRCRYEYFLLDHQGYRIILIIHKVVQHARGLEPVNVHEQSWGKEGKEEEQAIQRPKHSFKARCLGAGRAVGTAVCAGKGEPGIEREERTMLAPLAFLRSGEPPVG